MEDPKTFAALSALGKTKVLELLVAALTLAQAAKLVGGAPDPSRPRPPALSALLFDLAHLQIRTVSDLAKIGTTQATQLLDFARARSAAAGPIGCAPAQRPLPRVLVSPNLKPKDAPKGEPFTVPGVDKVAREYVFPTVLELNRLDPATGACTGALVFVRVEFTPPRICVPPGAVPAVVKLIIPWDDRIGAPGARYRACLPLEADGVPAVELIVELLIVP